MDNKAKIAGTLITYYLVMMGIAFTVFALVKLILRLGGCT